MPLSVGVQSISQAFMERDSLQISVYDYALPQERIARYPLTERDQSQLLVYRHGAIHATRFRDLAGALPSTSRLVFNNTRVIRARLHFRKDTGAEIEVFCLEPFEPADYESAFTARGKACWICMVGNLKRWHSGPLSCRIQHGSVTIELVARLAGMHKASQLVEFSWDPAAYSFAEILELSGETPIPPYLQRPAENSDILRYQTIYAHYNGSVAAPTAGLHFTQQVFESLEKSGIEKTEITLHVGAGTFRPVQAADATAHEMHAEHFIVSKRALEELLQHKGMIIATGTTTVRTLESIYWAGLRNRGKDESSLGEMAISQWDWKKSKPALSRQQAIEALLEAMDRLHQNELHCSTGIMITPGYPFMMTDGMITNFHQPRSTLLLLVSAFIGDDWRKVYDYALAHNFRFLSYGDSSLLLPRERKSKDNPHG